MNDYPRIIDKLKTSKLVQTLSSKAAPKPEKQRCMHSFNHEEWVADEYRDNMQELRNRLSNIAAQLHETTVALVRANLRIQELEEENTILRSGNQQ